MTNRERILAIMEGRLPDRLPWIPRLAIWYEANRREGTLPPEYEGRSLREVERDIFGGTAARDGILWRTELRGVEVRRRELPGMECFATSPMVPTTLAEARAAWGERMIIWGGVPSVILEDPYTDEQFEQAMDEVFRTIASGRAFILGIADNAMPGTKIERVRRITQWIEQRGAYPVQ